jgi:hypothetical protein
MNSLLHCNLSGQLAQQHPASKDTAVLSKSLVEKYHPDLGRKKIEKPSNETKNICNVSQNITLFNGILVSFYQNLVPKILFSGS